MRRIAGCTILWLVPGRRPRSAESALGISFLDEPAPHQPSDRLSPDQLDETGIRY
jgi:hypothetical protein